MRKILSLSLFLFVSINITIAQIENEIRAYVDSTELIVNNGRKLLVQQLNNENYIKAKEIYIFLNNKTLNSNYKAFTYNEKLYINVLIRDWNTILLLFTNYESEIKYHTYPNLYPIWSVLYDDIVKKSETLMLQLKNSELSNENKSIIELYLYLLKVGNIDNVYNKKLSNYLDLYRNSKYEKFIKNYLPNKQTKGSMSVSMGSGMILSSGKLKSNFNSGAMFNMSLDFNIEKIFTSLYFEGGGLFLKNSFQAKVNSDSITFNTDDRFSYFNGGLKGGYFLIRNKRLHFTPYLSISGLTIESTLYKDIDKDEYEVATSFCYGFGVHSEIKLFGFNHSNYYGTSLNSYISLKIESGYNIITKHKNNYSGNITYLNFALVWGIGDF